MERIDWILQRELRLSRAASAEQGVLSNDRLRFYEVKISGYSTIDVAYSTGTMEISQTLYVTDRNHWRRWLEEHYTDEQEIWLVYYRKGSGKPRIPYEDAVKEALCFGWIDSQVKNMDGERYAQRFSPRKPGSPYSQTNKERLSRLLAEGKVMPEVAAGIGDLRVEDYQFPRDILDALKANPQAWKNFRLYPGAYRRIRVAFVDAARKRPAEFEKRLNHLIEMCEQDKQFGYNIDEFF